MPAHTDAIFSCREVYSCAIFVLYWPLWFSAWPASGYKAVYWPQPVRALTPDEIDDRWATSAAARAQQNRTELYGLSAFAYQSQYVG